MLLWDWSVGVWPDLFLFGTVYVCSSVCAYSSYGLRSGRLIDELSALHCSISRQPQTITKYCPPAVFLLFPHTAASLFSSFPTETLHSSHSVYVGGKAQKNRKGFLGELLIVDA